MMSAYDRKAGPMDDTTAGHGARRTGAKDTVAAALLVGLALLVPSAPDVAAVVAPARSAPLVAAASDPGYRFFNQVGSKPYRWNPCVRLHYRITWNGVSTREGAVVRAALRMISAETGITFTYDGTSRVIPQRATWPSARLARTQLLIAFAYPGRGTGRSTMLSGSEVGVGGPAGRGVLYTSGAVLIDKRSWSTYHMGSKNRQILYMHELGHAMGLAHTIRRGQIMHSGYYPARAAWGTGDKTGLHKLGRAAGCPAKPGAA